MCRICPGKFLRVLFKLSWHENIYNWLCRQYLKPMFYHWQHVNVCVCVHARGVLFVQWSTAVSAKELLSLFWELIPTSSAKTPGCLIITPQWPHILSCLLWLRHVRFIRKAQYHVHYPNGLHRPAVKKVWHQSCIVTWFGGFFLRSHLSTIKNYGERHQYASVLLALTNNSLENQYRYLSNINYTAGMFTTGFPGIYDLTQLWE